MNENDIFYVKKCDYSIKPQINIEEIIKKIIDEKIQNLDNKINDLNNKIDILNNTINDEKIKLNVLNERFNNNKNDFIDEIKDIINLNLNIDTKTKNYVDSIKTHRNFYNKSEIDNKFIEFIENPVKAVQNNLPSIKELIVKDLKEFFKNKEQ